MAGSPPHRVRQPPYQRLPLDATSFWAELKRRRVVRLALIYVIVAWVVIQAADTIFPALGVPGWGVSLVVALTILGLPLALVLAWMFDMTGTGPRRTPPAGAHGVDPPPAHATGVSSPARPAAAGEADPAPRAIPNQRSIAVLPFVDMSEEGDSEFFSDGITEEILNALTRVREIRVASRTSSFSFKGKELDVNRAFAKLEQAYDDRSAGLVYLHLDPMYAPLRADSRFTDLVDRIGLEGRPYT